MSWGGWPLEKEFPPCKAVQLPRRQNFPRFVGLDRRFDHSTDVSPLHVFRDGRLYTQIGRQFLCGDGFHKLKRVWGFVSLRGLARL